MLVAAVFVVAGINGCSSGVGAAGPGPGQLAPGTAQLTLDGGNTVKSEAVQCLPNEHLMLITIGEEPPIAVAMVSNTEDLAVKWVRFHDAGGFSGSYNDGLGGKANATLAGSTYQITGVAEGFGEQEAARPTTQAFAVEVAC
ncbi:lipoprotein LpqH [Mycolicibacterium pulveris]|uniref:lipoprotein LpqH n=1 Tax=Mycolicibacterium pulveris TaxID=36813 RepID=UPI003CE85719